MGLLCSLESVGSRWLGPSLGCCASRHDYEDEYEEYRDIADNPLQFDSAAFEEPQHVHVKCEESFSRRPSTSYTASLSQWVTEGRGMIVRMSTHASSTTRSWYAQSNRPSIGQPSDFRRVDGINVSRRDSFRPLELSIALPNGRLSPLPDFSGDPADPTTELQMPQKALVRSRADSVISTDRLSNFTIHRKPVSSASMQDDRQSFRSSIICGPTRTETRASGASHFGSASIQSLPASYSSRSFSPHRLPSLGSRGNPICNRPRASTELRRAKMDVDEAISELNTIVEERRADALRSSSGSASRSAAMEHIPAIAPGMKVHARSKTLSEIGSAFSLPLAMKPLPAAPQPSSSVVAADNAEDDSQSLQSLRMSRSSSDLRPKSAPARDAQSRRSKPALAVSVKAMCEEIESAKSPRRTLSPDSAAPLSAPSMTSASLSQRLNTWLRRSLPSSPTTPTAKLASSDTPPSHTAPGKSALTTSITPVPALSSPPLFTTPLRQRATTTTNTKDSTRTNNTFFSTSTFSSPSARSTPSLVSSASSLSTLTTSPPRKDGTTIVAETGIVNDRTFRNRSASIPESEITPTPESDLDLELDSEDDGFPLRGSTKQLPARGLATMSEPSAAQMSMPMPAPPLSSPLMSPPAYQVTDPHPNSPVGSVVVGLAL